MAALEETALTKACGVAPPPHTHSFFPLQEWSPHSHPSGFTIWFLASVGSVKQMIRKMLYQIKSISICTQPARPDILQTYHNTGERRGYYSALFIYPSQRKIIKSHPLLERKGNLQRKWTTCRSVNSQSLAPCKQRIQGRDVAQWQNTTFTCRRSQFPTPGVSSSKGFG